MMTVTIAAPMVAETAGEKTEIEIAGARDLKTMRLLTTVPNERGLTMAMKAYLRLQLHLRLALVLLNVTTGMALATLTTHLGTGTGVIDALVGTMTTRTECAGLVVRLGESDPNCMRLFLHVLSGPPPLRRTPALEPQEEYNPDEPKEDDSEARSVFVSQLAARLTARDLGYFFEDKLGEGSVMDARIVTDRLSRRSKGCAP